MLAKKQSNTNPYGTVYPVLLIHGLFSRGEAWREARFQLVTRYNLVYGGDFKAGKTDNEQELSTGDFYTVTFSNRYDLSFLEQAQELQTAIENILSLNNAKKIILVGHSMGGLAARAYIQFINKADVFMLITVGTPHYGAPMALLRNSSENWASQVFSGMKRKLMKMAAGEEHAEKNRGFFKRLYMKLSQKTSESEKDLTDFLNSQAFLALAPESEELEKLNAAKLPLNIRYAFIIGDVSYQPILKTNLVSRFRRKLARKWNSFLRYGLHGITRKTLSNSLDIFINYFLKYNESITKEEAANKVLDSDGVVPVVSQAIAHLPANCELNLKVYCDSWHMSQMRRADKIYQALALGGAFNKSS